MATARRKTGGAADRAYEAGFQDGWRAGLERGRAARLAAPAPPVDPAVLREAVRLCHPDRHPPERFAIANRVTATLLGAIGANGNATSPA
jgi:hypothetical protein